MQIAVTVRMAAAQAKRTSASAAGLGDAMEELNVGRLAPERVLEEWERRPVGRGERAEQVVVLRQHVLEPVEPGGHLRFQLLDPRRVGIWLCQLGFDLVWRPLPDAVEPVDEDARLRPLRPLRRIQRRVGICLLEILEDRRRIGDYALAVDDHRDERLAAHSHDLTAVVGVDPDRFDIEALVREGEGDALDVGRVPDAVRPDRASVPSSP